MSGVCLKKAADEQDFQMIEELAGVIWREHYAAIIPAAQIEYMLECFQTKEAIARAVAEGYEYYAVRRPNAAVGYIGVKANEPAGKLFLSKIYLKKAYRGKGYAKDAIGQLEGMCKRRGLSAIWLTVNKQNPSVRQYEKMGFATIREQCADIGDGFVMDDYVMEKQINMVG